MRSSRLVVAAVIAASVVAFFALDSAQYLDLDYFKSHHAALDAYFRAHPIATVLIFAAVYIAITGLSIPGATILTLVAGALFGLLWGTVIVSFASSIGATAAFLASRFLFRDAVQKRFRDQLQTVNRGIERDGAFYLLALRLAPYVPFFIINLVLGLTPMRTRTFYLVSQVGMLPATVVYVNAGMQLARVGSLADLVSPRIVVALTLLAVFPLIAKFLADALRRRRALVGFPRPRAFDRNLIVIGAGSAGLVAAYIAAAVRAKVTLIEKDKMGGECLHTGCVPSKAFIRSARFVAQAARAHQLGMRKAGVEFEFADIMARVQRVIKTIEPHDSAERYTKLGVECVRGEARVVSPYAVTVNGRTLTARNIILATGSRPLVPPIPGLADVGFLTSDSVWGLRERPRRLLVLGGGPIGCELAQAFAHLGSHVTLVEHAPQILNREDPEFTMLVAGRFRDDGIDLRMNHQAMEFLTSGDTKTVVCEHAGTPVSIEFDQVLVALGRVATTSGYGLEALGINTAHGAIEVDEFLQTRIPTIYACGDVAGPYQFTHAAAHQAWHAAVNALFGPFRRFKVDYSALPWCTFTDPEVARVGLNEQDAKKKGIAYEVTKFGIEELDRAIADEAAHGLVKVLTAPGKDKILGATVAGERAGDYIIEFVLAMRHGLGLNKILSTVHIYPTFAEANKYAAGAWKRAHAPERLLKWVERYHRWRLR